MSENEQQLIKIDPTKCTLCYSCIRVCPVDAIEVKPDNDYARIIPERCIGCGSCLNSCPESAINYRENISDIEKLIESEYQVAAVLDASIAGEFEDILDYRKFVQMLRLAGFNFVHEAAFSVDIIASKYKNIFDDFRGKYYISTLCPVTVSYVEKYLPDLIDNLLPVMNPSIASAHIVRSVHDNPNLKIVYIGPCIALKDLSKKFEDTYKIDIVLTFEELRDLFNKKNIVESKTEFSNFDNPTGHMGHLFPIKNGILQAADINESLLEGKVANQDGPFGFAETLKEYNAHLDIIQNHLNIFYCRGCLMGPGMTSKKQKHYRRALVIKYALKRGQQFDKKTWERNLNLFKDNSFSCSFKSDDQRLPMPPEEKIKEILEVIHKDDSNEKGCLNCGYDSCRSFAVAVAHGLAKTDMCLAYNISNKQEFIEALRNSNEKLALAQKAMRESEEKAKRGQQLAQEASDRMKTLLQQLPSGIVIVDDKLKIVQANNKFIDVLGDEAKAIDEIIPGLEGADIKSLLPANIVSLFQYTLNKDENVINHDVHFNDQLYNISVFAIRKSKVIGAVIRDMYLPEVRKEEVIGRIDEVITQNLNMVQQIAFLLGDGASKTERMLNSVIESYQKGKDEK